MPSATKSTGSPISQTNASSSYMYIIFYIYIYMQLGVYTLHMTVACLIVSCFLAWKLTNVCIFYFTFNRNTPQLFKTISRLVFGLQITVQCMTCLFLPLSRLLLTSCLMPQKKYCTYKYFNTLVPNTALAFNFTVNFFFISHPQKTGSFFSLYFEVEKI